MIHVAISQLTTARWELPLEVARITEHGFDSLSLWRPKLSDIGAAAAAGLLTAGGVRASCLQWAGGFTGCDGRSHRDCVDDAVEAIDDAAALGAACLVIHSGGRGGHTRAHSRRLLLDALETLAPIARSAGVTLALRPMTAAAAEQCSFLHTPGEALALVEQIGDPAIRLAIDLWQFGDAPDLTELLPRLAAATAVVQVADRNGPPTREFERRPCGRGSLSLDSLVMAFFEHGFRGDFEFDPVGEEVTALGYDAVLAETRRVVDGLNRAVSERLQRGRTTPAARQSAGLRPTTAGLDDAAADLVVAADRDALQFRSAGSRRSQASSQTVSRG